MSRLSFFIGIVLLTSVFQAQARSFYKTSFKINLHYSELTKDTLNLLNMKNFDVHYSDDHDFCIIIVGDQSFECLTYHIDDEPELANITINREEGAALVAAALEQIMCKAKIEEAFHRLSKFLNDTINIEFQGDDFYQQLHDRESESFHIWMYDIQKGEKY